MTKKRKINRKYDSYIIPEGNYYSFGSDLKQAFDFKDIKNASASPLSGAVGALGNTVGQLGGSAISGGLESGAGKVFSGLSGVASAIPGPWGAVASAGLGILGGLTNRMFGSKLNEENIAQVEGDINRMNSARSSASSFDELNTTMSNTVGKMDFSNSFIGKDGWFSNKAKNKAKTLREANNRAALRQDLALLNNAEQLSADQLGLLEANYAAEGGPIHIKKANRGKFTDYCGGKVTSECIAKGKRSSSPAVRKRATFAANSRSWNKHSLGGFIEGREYDIDESEIRKLLDAGYEIEYL